MTKGRSKKKTGPKPDRLKLKGDWKRLMGKALKKERPVDGWPEPEKGKKKRG